MSKKLKGRKARQRRKTQKQVLTVLLAVVIIVAACFGGAYLYQRFKKASTEELVQAGTLLMQEENYEEAVKRFEEAIAVETSREEEGKAAVTQSGTPYITEAYRGLGMVYYELQDYEQARENLQKVIDLKGEVTPVLYNLLGISAMQMKDYEGALQAFAAGVAIPSESAYTAEDGSTQSVDFAEVIQEMKFNRIVCLEKILDWENAKIEMEAYVAEYPEDTSVQKEAEFLSTR